MLIATTTLIPLHANTQSIATVLGRTTDYVTNPEKTNGGEFISSYECDPLIADAEFQFAQSQYENITGRNQNKNNVIAYHLRQSFKPGEIEPETANKIGYELAMRLTKGKNAFLVCTHVDKAHVHSHIIINSVNLDHDRKFRNFKNSSFAIRKISDQICLEHGLSVIENPKPSRGHYGKWQQSQIELKSSEKFNLLMDIQAKIQQGYNENWSKVQNLKDAAQTLIFLQENNLTDYDKLTDVTNESTKIFNGISTTVKEKDSRLTEISELQKQISNYSRTKEIYAQYKKSGWNKKFYAEHKSEIILHKAAKKYFDESGYGKNKKLPTINMLRQEYATILSEKKKLYSEYKTARETMIKLKTAKQNVDMFLNIKPSVERQRKSFEISI